MTVEFTCDDPRAAAATPTALDRACRAEALARRRPHDQQRLPPRRSGLSANNLVIPAKRNPGAHSRACRRSAFAG
jgi:hypothetical protein